VSLNRDNESKFEKQSLTARRTLLFYIGCNIIVKKVLKLLFGEHGINDLEGNERFCLPLAKACRALLFCLPDELIIITH